MAEIEMARSMPTGVHYFADGLPANLMEYSEGHPEIRYILYSGADVDDATIWMVSDTTDNRAIDALISMAKTKKGFYQMINKESLAYERIGGFLLYDN